MSWMGILFLLGGIYLSVVIIRGVIDFIRWLFEDWDTSPKVSEKRPRRPDGPAHNVRNGETLQSRTPI